MQQNNIIIIIIITSFLGPKASLVMGSWSGLQFQAWVPFYWVGLNKKVIGCSHSIHAMIAVVCVTYHADHYYSSQGSQLARLLMTFLPLTVCPASKEEASMSVPAWFLCHVTCVFSNSLSANSYGQPMVDPLLSSLCIFWGILLFIYSGSLAP